MAFASGSLFREENVAKLCPVVATAFSATSDLASHWRSWTLSHTEHSDAGSLLGLTDRPLSRHFGSESRVGRTLPFLAQQEPGARVAGRVFGEENWLLQPHEEPQRSDTEFVAIAHLAIDHQAIVVDERAGSSAQVAEDRSSLTILDDAVPQADSLA